MIGKTPFENIFCLSKDAFYAHQRLNPLVMENLGMHIFFLNFDMSKILYT